MPEELITFGEAARLLFVARPYISKLIADGALTATEGMLKRSEVLDYKLKQRTATETFLSGQTEEYWSTDVPTNERKPPTEG